MGTFTKPQPAKAALKMAMFGPAGSGKTFTALLIAEGLAKLAQGKRIALVDTEQGSAFYSQDVPARQPHPKAFDFEGTPKQRAELVENGVFTGVVWDRTTARRAGNGRQSTGHAPPSSLRHWGPLPFGLSVAGGEADSPQELAELIGDGIYITRLHYLSIVDAREGVITGMTRDGTFRVRSGKIAEPLVNLRFTVAVPELLAELPGLTREQVLLNQSAYYDERYPQGMLSPAVATAHFDVTGVGSGPGV